ncbi:hypothetical protein [Brevibacterium sp. CS2]|uniref:hypothetical protein n=1 Tax=Brevibacterium sp. CS2 TaxID=2575923 RepID=UPI001C2F70F3|nr:hypothetical protein [Brevibacterium sp. CS2]
MHVPSEGEAVVQVCFGLFVLDVAGVDLGVEEREPTGDAVLLRAEQVEGHGSGVVSLHELGALVTERVAFGFVPLGLVLGDLVQAVELAGDQLAQRGNDVFGLKRPGSDGDSRYLIPTRCSRSAWTA